jgi:hypothetical protein
MIKQLSRILIAFALLCSVIAFTSSSALAKPAADYVDPEYLYIGGHAWSNFVLGTQEATLEVCADNLYQNNFWVEMYRGAVPSKNLPPRVWKYNVVSGKIVSAQYWNSIDHTPLDGAPVNINVSGNATISGQYKSYVPYKNYGVNCYKLSNIDGAGNTLPGVKYYTVVWYENPAYNMPGDPEHLPSTPYSTEYKGGCYASLNGTHLCDTKP